MSKKVYVVFLFTGKGGKYVQIVPDFEKFKLVPTTLRLDGVDFVPYGMVQHYGEHVRNYPDLSKPAKDEIRLELFSKFIADLNQAVLDLDLDSAYILIDIKQDQDAGKYWSFIADYQFLLRREK